MSSAACIVVAVGTAVLAALGGCVGAARHDTDERDCGRVSPPFHLPFTCASRCVELPAQQDESRSLRIPAQVVCPTVPPARSCGGGESR